MYKSVLRNFLELNFPIFFMTIDGNLFGCISSKKTEFLHFFEEVNG